MTVKINDIIKKKIRKINLIISDVDGVLTDGGMYYSSDGEIMKKFNTKDGMGVELLKNHDIQTVLITKEQNNIVKKRADKLKIKDVYMGIKNKEILLPQITKKFVITNDEIAYIGDDVNDVSIMKKVGFTACPANAIDSVKEIVDYVCTKNGGEGSFREVVDLILSIKQKN